jgi:hypothetical protein
MSAGKLHRGDSLFGSTVPGADDRMMNARLQLFDAQGMAATSRR